MDLAPLALCRIPDEPRAIVLNARQDHLDVAVIADRLPQVIRRLSLPGEAESLKERLPLVAEEFNRTVAFYNSSHMEKPLDVSVPVFVCGDLAEAPEMWPAAVSHAGYPVSPLPSPLEVPEGFDANEFMVNIGLALKELRPAKEEANFSIVNFNALPEVYVPPRFSIVRVVVPVASVIGVGLIVFGALLIQNTRAEIASLRSEVKVAETTVTQLQGDIARLRAQVGSVEAIANELNSRLVTMEQGRANIYLDLREIRTLADGRAPLTLTKIEHNGSSITVRGSAPNEGLIYKYARDLRASPRFSKVWVDEIDSGFGFKFSVTPK